MGDPDRHVRFSNANTVWVLPPREQSRRVQRFGYQSYNVMRTKRRAHVPHDKLMAVKLARGLRAWAARHRRPPRIEQRGRFLVTYN